MDCPKLTIETNHGRIVLENVSVVHTYEYRQYGASPDSKPQFIGRIVEGTVIGGSETNRLFHVTSTRHFKVGSTMRVDLYGVKVHEDYREKGTFHCSLETCG